jgi:hypothetical protein
LDLQLPMQSVSITTDVVCIKFASDLRQVDDFLGFLHQ